MTDDVFPTLLSVTRFTGGKREIVYVADETFESEGRYILDGTQVRFNMYKNDTFEPGSYFFLCTGYDHERHSDQAYMNRFVEDIVHEVFEVLEEHPERGEAFEEYVRENVSYWLTPDVAIHTDLVGFCS